MTQRLFTGGSVFDGRRHHPGWGVVTDGDRVVAVGPSDELSDAFGSADTEQLSGGLVTAGFQDAHLHPMVGGLEQRSCDLSDLSGRDDYLERIREHARRHPDATWIRGGGWSLGAFGPDGPTVADLDSVVPDRPVFLPSTDHHDAWVNTKALELAGVTAATPDPPDGWVVRDRSGNPVGPLREAAMGLVWEHLSTSQDEYTDALRHAQSFLHSQGIVGWQDALIGGYAGLDDPTQAYLDLIDAGELSGPVRCSQWWDRHRGVEQVDDLVAQREALAERGLDAGAVKVMADGIAETFTAAVVEDYEGDTHCPCGNHGIAFLDRGAFVEAVRALDGAGLQVHVHAIGDRAVRDALDGIAAARVAHGMNDLRHHVAHLQLVRPEDRARFRTLGVVANVQGMWVDAETPAVTLLEPKLDERRRGWQYPFADIVGHGAVTAGGSDWPVNPPAPLSAIHALVNRRGAGSQGRRLVPDQALTLEQAFATYTSGSAFVNHADGCGTVQVGAAAHLTVLDRDPFTLPPDEVGEVSVRATYVAGRCVFRAG